MKMFVTIIFERAQLDCVSYALDARNIKSKIVLIHICIVWAYTSFNACGDVNVFSKTLKAYEMQHEISSICVRLIIPSECDRA